MLPRFLGHFLVEMPLFSLSFDSKTRHRSRVFTQRQNSFIDVRALSRQRQRDSKSKHSCTLRKDDVAVAVTVLVCLCDAQYREICLKVIPSKKKL